MKKLVLLLLLIAPSAFATKGNSDVGSSTSTLKCRAVKNSNEDRIKIELNTEAFDVKDYSGAAQIKVQGLSTSFMNVTTDKSVYIKLENNNSNPAFIIPLEFQGDGQVILYFNDKNGETARVVYRSAMDDKESVIGLVTCTRK